MATWHRRERRTFLTAVLGGTIGAASGLVALVSTAGSGLATSLWPVWRKSTSTSGILMPITSLDALASDGVPRRFPVIADRTDAWVRAKDQVVGGIFLVRTGEAEDSITAFQIVCPHAGCTIMYSADGNDGKGEFLCPCHNAHFALDGKRLQQKSPSPRDMDTLEVTVKEGMVFVKFENFELNTPEKVVV